METTLPQNAPQPTAQSQGLISIGELFSKSWGLFTKVFWKYLLTVLMPILVLVIVVLIMGIAFFTTSSLNIEGTPRLIILFVSGLIGLVALVAFIYLSIIAQAASLRLIASHHYGQIKGVIENFKESKPFALNLFSINILVALSVFGWFLLLIIPGIVYAIYYCMSSWAYLGEGFTENSAKKRSKELVSGYWWPVLFRLLALGLIYLLLGLPLAFIQEGSVAYNSYDVITRILNLFLAPFSAIFTFYLFLDLAAKKPNSSVQKTEKNNVVAIVAAAVLFIIVVIGFLSTLAVVSLNSATVRSRDAKRIADMKQIQVALELYYNDLNEYPADVIPGQAISDGKTMYMSKIPNNPTPAGKACPENFEYKYEKLDAKNYKITFCIEEDKSTYKAGFHFATPAGIDQEPINLNE